MSRSILLLLGLATLAGCSNSSPETWPVEGKVVFRDGTPLGWGTVELESLETRLNARGQIERDGTFSLTTFEPGDGAVAGRHRVVVQQLVVADTPGLAAHQHGPQLEAKYASYETSGLAVEIEPGKTNELRLVVDAARRPRR